MYTAIPVFQSNWAENEEMFEIEANLIDLGVLLFIFLDNRPNRGPAHNTVTVNLILRVAE